MLTPPTSKQHIRNTNRYLTGEEWRVIEPRLPGTNVTGRPRAWPMREIIRSIFYVMRAGCPWRLLPSDLPLWSTIYRWFAKFRDKGRFKRINHAWVMIDRERILRQCSPTGAIIDSQSAKTIDSGYAGEKVAKATLISVEIVRKKADQVGFAVNPRRWVVERFFAWIGHNRRLAKDFEAIIDPGRAFLYAAPSCCSCVGSLVVHDFRNRLSKTNLA